MPSITSIQWTDATWNPLRGCSRVSEGCRNCYAERIAARFSRLAKMTPSGPRWSGEVQLVDSLLTLPLRWKAPRRVFVNSMSDLFHEKAEAGWIVSIFDVMRRCPQHTFQILTKRPALMRDWMSVSIYGETPLPNVWLGVSVEGQATADERIPLLLQTPAALRWVSYEPALGPVDFELLKVPIREPDEWGIRDVNPTSEINALDGTRITSLGLEYDTGRRLDWIVIGGESGPGARPFDLAWARSTIAQCRAASVPVFVKQLGAKPTTDHRTRPAGENSFVLLRDRKGGDMDEWPTDLRVREFPK